MNDKTDAAAWARVPERLRDIDAGDLTVATLLQRRAVRSGNAPFVSMNGRWFTGIDVVREARLWTKRFELAGVAPGERVAIMSRNRPEFLLAVLGAALGGMVAVVVNAELRAAQLEHVLTDSRPRVLISDAVALESLAEIDMDCVGQLWCFDAADVSRPQVLPVPVAAEGGTVVPAGSGSPFVIIYTSGTTGLPKGVVCPQAQFFWWGVNTGAELGLTPADVLYTTLPLFHTNALSAFFQALVFDTKYVIGERFSASRFWKDLVATEATVTFLLGTMISILTRRDRVEFDDRHRVRVALAPATPPDLVQHFADEFHVELLEGYGSTETSHVISTPLDNRRPGWMGRIIPGFEARVVDAAGIPVPVGVTGELILRHAEPFSFASGYLNAPEKTTVAWRDLWFHTGDLVAGSGDGWYRFVDRLSDSLRRRGENVSTHEVESAIAAYPGVDAVAAFGVPSELGEQDVMVVVTSPTQQLDFGELVTFCRRRLARFAVPRYIRVVEQMPMTETGKIRKSALRAEGVTDDTFDAELTAAGPCSTNTKM